MSVSVVVMNVATGFVISGIVIRVVAVTIIYNGVAVFVVLLWLLMFEKCPMC